MKDQGTRLFEIFVVAPLMIWGGNKLRTEHPFLGSFLLISGMSQALFTTQNYLLVERGDLGPE